ncbi:MAG: hypothetical protein HQL32_04450 [Planctomycetes bacterium]|nr:hypothetical protein [Planctomycetota bacterium]
MASIKKDRINRISHKVTSVFLILLFFSSYSASAKPKFYRTIAGAPKKADLYLVVADGFYVDARTVTKLYRNRLKNKNQFTKVDMKEYHQLVKKTSDGTFTYKSMKYVPKKANLYYDKQDKVLVDFNTVPKSKKKKISADKKRYQKYDPSKKNLLETIIIEEPPEIDKEHYKQMVNKLEDGTITYKDLTYIPATANLVEDSEKRILIDLNTVPKKSLKNYTDNPQRYLKFKLEK